MQKLPEPILEQAEAAALRGNWPVVIDCLQHLLGQVDAPRDGTTDWSERLLGLALPGLINGDFQVRWDLAQLVPSLGSAAIAPLVALLANPAAEPEAQWFAIRILGQIPDPAVIPALIALLATTTDTELQGMAITVLASLGDESIAVLGGLLSHPTQKLLATQALAQIRQPVTIPWLLTVVDDVQATVRERAIAALGSFLEPRLLPVLLTALADPVASVRQAAVTALGFWATVTDQPAKQPDIVAYLQPLLEDQDLAVSQLTAIALSRWGNASAIVALSDRLASSQTPEPLALEIVRALSWIGQASALQGLQQALQLPLSGPVQQEILLRLGRVESPELQPQATQILLDVLNQATLVQLSRLTQQTIALALGQLRQPAALHPLIHLLAEPDNGLRLHVIAALKMWDAPIAYQQLQQLADTEIRDPNFRDGIAIALQEWSL